MNTVQLYGFVYRINNVRYAGSIPAVSWEDAQRLVPFAEVDGIIIEEYIVDSDMLIRLILNSVKARIVN